MSLRASRRTAAHATLGRWIGFFAFATALALSGCPGDQRDRRENPVNNPPTLGSVTLPAGTIFTTGVFSYSGLQDAEGGSLTLTVEWQLAPTVPTPVGAVLLAAGTAPGSIFGSQVISIPSIANTPVSGTFEWDAVADLQARGVAPGTYDNSNGLIVTVTPSSGGAVGTPVIVNASVRVPAGNTPPQLQVVAGPTTSVTTTATLTWTNLVDNDGDPGILTFSWRIEGPVGSPFIGITNTATILSTNPGSLGPGTNEITVPLTAGVARSGTSVWDAVNDLSASAITPGTYQVSVSAVPRDGTTGALGLQVGPSVVFDVVVPSPLDILNVTVSGRRGDITLSFTLDDADGPRVRMEIFFRIQDPSNPGAFTESKATLEDPTDTLTIGSTSTTKNQITGLENDPTPGLTTANAPYIVTWNSLRDVGGQNPPPIQLVFRGFATGTQTLEREVITAPFLLQNLPVIDRIVTQSFDPFFAPVVLQGETFRVEGENFSTNEPTLGVLINGDGNRVLEANSRSIVVQPTGIVNTGFLQVATASRFNQTTGQVIPGSLSSPMVIKVEGNDIFQDGGLRTSFPTAIPQRADATNHVAFGDIDGDGDLDIIAGTQDQNFVYVNQNVNERLVARLPEDYDATTVGLVGTATSSTASTLVDANGPFLGDAADFIGRTVAITAGTGLGQTAVITGVPSATTLDISPATWPTNPDNTSQYTVRSANPELSLYVVQSIVCRNTGPYRIPDVDAGFAVGGNDDISITVTPGYGAVPPTTFVMDLNGTAGARRSLSALEVAATLNNPAARVSPLGAPLRFKAVVLNSNQVEIVPLSPADILTVTVPVPGSFVNPPATFVLGIDPAFGNDTGGTLNPGGPGAFLDATDFTGPLTAAQLATAINTDFGQTIVDGTTSVAVFDTSDIFVIGNGTANQIIDFESDRIEARVAAPYNIPAASTLTLDVGGLTHTFTLNNGPFATAADLADEINTDNDLLNTTANGALPLLAEPMSGGRIRIFSTNGQGVHVVYALTSNVVLDAVAFLGKFVKPHARGIGRYLDETTTRFPVASVPTQQDFTTRVLLFDCDADGDLDIYFANAREQSRLLINDGTGVYEETRPSNPSSTLTARLPAFLDATHGAAVGDVDLDGDFDLVVANEGPNRVLLNNGVGLFTSAGRSLFVGPDNTFGTADDPENFDSFSSDVAVGDFLDGAGGADDGFPDIVFANLSRDSAAPNEGPQVFHGTGLAAGQPLYEDVTADLLPVTAWPPVVPGGPDAEVPGGNFGVVLGFIDNDENLDIVIVSSAEGTSLLTSPNSQPNSTNRIFINDPAVFQAAGLFAHGIQSSYFPWFDPSGDGFDDNTAMNAAATDAWDFVTVPLGGNFVFDQLVFEKLDVSEFDNSFSGIDGRIFSDMSRMVALASTGKVHSGDPAGTLPIRARYIAVANDLDPFTLDEADPDPNAPTFNGQNEIYVRNHLTGAPTPFYSGLVEFDEGGLLGQNLIGHWSPWRQIDQEWDFFNPTVFGPPENDFGDDPADDAYVPFVPLLSDETLGCALADIDSDGDIDAYFANKGQDRLVVNHLQQ